MASAVGFDSTTSASSSAHGIRADTVETVAILTDEERRTVWSRLEGEGWPAVVEKGVIVINFLGREFRLDQGQVSPAPLSGNVVVRLVPVEARRCYQQLAAPTAASWLLNRFQVQVCEVKLSAASCASSPSFATLNASFDAAASSQSTQRLLCSGYGLLPPTASPAIRSPALAGKRSRCFFSGSASSSSSPPSPKPRLYVGAGLSKSSPPLGQPSASASASSPSAPKYLPLPFIDVDSFKDAMFAFIKRTARDGHCD